MAAHSPAMYRTTTSTDADAATSKEGMGRSTSMAVASSSALANPASPADPSLNSTNLPPRLNDRFDWRQTAASFRRLHLQDGRVRKPPSTGFLAATNQRDAETKQRIVEYQKRLGLIMYLERAQERHEWEQRKSRSMDQLTAEGSAIEGLVGYWQGGNPAFTVVRGQPARDVARARPCTAIFSRTGMQKLVWTQIKAGDVVELSPSESTETSLQDYLPRAEDGANISDLVDHKGELRLTASVLSIDAYRIKLLFRPPHSLADVEACTSWRLDVGYSEALNAMVDEALRRMAADTSALEHSDPHGRAELRGTYLAAALLPTDRTESADVQPSMSLRSTFEEDQRIRSWYERYSQPDPIVVEGDPDLGLNASQLRAVATMIGSQLSLVQGPPGTGKTYTLVSAIKLLKHHFAVPHPILLSAHTNIAVDNLVEGAIDAGLRVVRVGTIKDATGQRVKDRTLDKLMEQHELWPQLEEAKLRLGSIRKRIAEAHDSQMHQKNALGTRSPLVTKEIKAEIAELKRKAACCAQSVFVLTSRMQKEILYEADVVASTLFSSSTAPLRCIDFPLVFIDESSQALEACTLMPLMKGARQVALIGDHKQLPPVLKSRQALFQGGAKSLFERLLEEDGWNTASLDANTDPASAPEEESTSPSYDRTKMQMLQVQHRMHPDLAEFPNKQFYGSQLFNAESTKAITRIQHSLPLPDAASDESRLMFIDHSGPEAKLQLGPADASLLNKTETSLLFHLLYDLLTRNSGKGQSLSGSSIGIITPYLAQSRTIGRLLRPAYDSDIEHPVRKAIERAFSEEGKAHLISELETVEVNTVDGFQGREKDVIIFSSVRCGGGGGGGGDGGASAGKTDAQGASSSPGSSTQTSGPCSDADFAEGDDLDFEGQQYSVGFLADERRLNVALTRAKKALFVLGNLQTWRCATASPLARGIIPVNSSSAAGEKPQSSKAEAPLALSRFAEHVIAKGVVVPASELVRVANLGLELEERVQQSSLGGSLREGQETAPRAHGQSGTTSSGVAGSATAGGSFGKAFV